MGEGKGEGKREELVMKCLTSKALISKGHVSIQKHTLLTSCLA